MQTSSVERSMTLTLGLLVSKTLTLKEWGSCVFIQG